MPVVPRIDSPPTMPSRPLRVLAASASPPGMAISISTSPASPWAAAISAMASRSIWRGTGLMAGSPGGMGRPGRVTVPTPSPARKLTPLPARGAADRGEDQCPVGDVGIVAGILHHAGRRRAVAQRRGGQRESRMLPARQGHLDRIGKLPGQQRLIGRLGGRRGAGAGGPAIAERAVVGCHVPRYSADNPFRHFRKRGP